MSSVRQTLAEVAARKEAYAAGHAAGRQEALLKVQSELSHVALESRVNDDESRYENFVIMLSDVDKVIHRMLEDT